MHPWVLLWVPSRAWLPLAPSWPFPITAALRPQSLLPQEQGLRGAVRGCRLTQCNTENSTAAVAGSRWAPACLACLSIHQHFWAEVRSLEELSTFWLLRWSPSFPWYPLLGMSVSSKKLSPSC